MPDAFFQKKRKRTSASGAGARAGPSRSKPSSSASSSRMRKPNADSDADDDDVTGGGIDDMDLTHNYNDAPNSDDEAEAAETPAEARVRLAKMYLQGLSDSPAGDDFFEGAEQPSFGLADAAQADRDNIAARLQKDVAEQSGKIHLFLADRIAASPTANDAESGTVLAVKGHRLSVTAAVASADAKWLFTASKDGNIIRWRMSDGKMVRVLPRRARVLGDDGQPVPPTTANRSKTSGAARRRARFTAAAAANGDKGKTSDRADAASYISVGAEQGHTDEIWSLSLSSDGSYLASGGKDSRVCVWDTTPRSEEKFLKALGGHKDAISAVQFRTGSHELYTASLDRTLKLYDVAQLSYIETLFGHQESVLSLSCLGAETAVSAGGRDRTCRFWKIRDESQLVFRAGAKSKLRDVLEGGDLARQALSGEGGKMSAPTEAVEGSVEVVAMIDQSHFVSGGDSGSVSLWNLGRKKPVHSVPVAHGFELTTSESEGEIRTPRWITAVAALPYSDVFASASWDGNVRLWKIIAPGGSIRSFEPLMDVSVQGVVNSIQLVQPPLSSVRVASDGTLGTNALVASKWKHAKGAAETEGKALTRVTATKQNAPPLLIVAAGKEHRLGRWINLPTATNATTIFPLTLTHAQ